MFWQLFSCQTRAKILIFGVAQRRSVAPPARADDDGQIAALSRKNGEQRAVLRVERRLLAVKSEKKRSRAQNFGFFKRRAHKICLYFLPNARWVCNRVMRILRRRG